MIKRMTSLCICIGLCAVLSIVLGACGDQVKITDDMTPTQTAEAFLDSFKAQEWDNMDTIYAGSSEDFVNAYQMPKDGDETSQALYNSFMSKIYDFDYEIIDEEISDDEKTAAVRIKTKTYDMVSVFNNFYQEYMDQALDTYSGNTGNMSEQDLQKMANEILQKELDNATEKTYEGEATLNMKKTDGRWVVDKIDENNADFLNAISGGMMDVAGDILTTRQDTDTGSGSEDVDKNGDDPENEKDAE